MVPHLEWLDKDSKLRCALVFECNSHFLEATFRVPLNICTTLSSLLIASPGIK